jgi:hypothetical protein
MIPPTALQVLEHGLKRQDRLLGARLVRRQIGGVLAEAQSHGGVDQLRDALVGFGGLDPQRPMQTGIEIDGGGLRFGHGGTIAL